MCLSTWTNCCFTLLAYYVLLCKRFFILFFIRQEAAGALWNLSFDDRNREGIALAGGVEALV